MNETPFCTQLSAEIDMVIDAIDPLLTPEERDQIGMAVTELEHAFADVGRPLAASIALQLAANVLSRIVGADSDVRPRAVS
jgi:hypothetical protein